MSGSKENNWKNLIDLSQIADPSQRERIASELDDIATYEEGQFLYDQLRLARDHMISKGDQDKEWKLPIVIGNGESEVRLNPDSLTVSDVHINEKSLISDDEYISSDGQAYSESHHLKLLLVHEIAHVVDKKLADYSLAHKEAKKAIGVLQENYSDINSELGVVEIT